MTGPRSPHQKSDQNPEEDPKRKEIDPAYERPSMGQSSSHGSLPHKTPTKPVGKFVRSDLDVTSQHEKQIDPTNRRGSLEQFSSNGTLPEEEPQLGQEEISNLSKKKYYKSKN
jgi:hypothetical protein